MRKIEIDPARLAAIGGQPSQEWPSITYSELDGSPLSTERKRISAQLIHARSGTYRGTEALAIQAATIQRLVDQLTEIDRQAADNQARRQIEIERATADDELRRRCANFLKGQPA